MGAFVISRGHWIIRADRSSRKHTSLTAAGSPHWYIDPRDFHERMTA